ncbi:MAG TPA: hypothetical protein VMW74_08385 [Nitrosopumilaceae archaeon]|nr:hypothetical protein [Nitrosopumilaceae archaeon]
MKDEAKSLVEDVKIYSDGLIKSIEKGNIKESSDYAKKMKDHIAKVQEYLEMKKSIQDN